MTPRNRSVLVLGSLLGAATVLCTAHATAAGKPADPEITFEYSNLFDTGCFAAIKTPLDTAAVEELRSRTDSWRERWERDAPILFETTVKLTGQPFKFHEAKATLFTCPAFVAMSTPLILNVRRLLKTTAGDGFMGPPAFSRLVFHEVLHRYVAERLRELPGATTPTLQKYKDEPQAVRSHLYNLSIMEMVFLALGREDDLNEDRKWMRTLGAVPGRGEGDLRRALAIIGKETAAALVKELAGR